MLPRSLEFVRGKKTRSTLKLSDLPQGVIPPSEVQPHEEDTGPAYPTVVLQARRNMQKFDNCVLLTRVGGFYELYFEHAEEYGPLLHLKVAQKKTSAGPVPMSGGLLHDRRVARIITPGTLIDENFIDPYANNYVMALHVTPPPAPEQLGPDHESGSSQLRGLDCPERGAEPNGTELGGMDSPSCPDSPDVDLPLGLAWLDLSTGHFFTQSTNLSSLSSILSRISPREVILDQSFRSRPDHGLSSILAEDRYVITYAPIGDRRLELDDWTPMLESELPQDSRQAFTKEESGARLLNEWLSSPSTSLDVINNRQELVARFIEDETLRETIILFLKRSHDSQRLVQKFALGRGDPDDLVALANTIRATEEIVRLLTEHAGQEETAAPTPETEVVPPNCLSAMAARIILDGPLKLAKRIKDAIDEEGIVHRHEIEDTEADHMLALAQEVVTSEGGQRAVDHEAERERHPQKLHRQLDALLEDKTALGETLREQLGAQSLTLRWSPGLGHICHVKGKDSRSLANLKTLSSSRTTRSFHAPEWTNLGQRIDQTRLHIRNEEQRVFHALRESVVLSLVKLRRNAAVLDELDVTTSFAGLALERGLVRPRGLQEQGRSFMRNDCLVGSPSHGRVWLITGPNMAGKSTFLRQNALITILAQIGCYVPASYASLGIVDAIFSRVGSADNLFRDQSTFMVEMLETAHILRAATPRSFVIMDEIGRGTTPEDGTAVAYAALHHLATVNRCRTLFATHFHAVADMAEEAGLCAIAEKNAGLGGENTRGGAAVEMYCTDVQEDEGGGFVYVHKLRKGVNRQSHALKVARLAGMPEAAIKTAKQVLCKTGVDGARRSTNGRMIYEQVITTRFIHKERRSAGGGVLEKKKKGNA
ncbi:unnamed protein product [Parascedosporium putredinis]|uniref:DNA mismatch repair proteins mutS family domain-containing protein n=1 Tax=Parascedosporium putredinis TaxID=1442378 RepID=A0A9P1MCQ2_9PEZI|nr:unnamed protein product [Parascedosporium putredinis]CAI7998231.1 unnamed protein product [Parascedosporium putredinis]